MLLLSRGILEPGREAPVTGGVIRAGKANASAGRYPAGLDMARANIRLLGGLEILGRDGAPAALPTRKAQALLAILARRPGEPVARARLAGLLWSDRPDEQGRASLRQAVRTRRGVYCSRSRGIWVKGETSGCRQDLLRVDLDCDRDAMRFTVRQHGSGFCHNHTWTCWGDSKGG